MEQGLPASGAAEKPWNNSFHVPSAAQLGLEKACPWGSLCGSKLLSATPVIARTKWRLGLLLPRQALCLAQKTRCTARLGGDVQPGHNAFQLVFITEGGT